MVAHAIVGLAWGDTDRAPGDAFGPARQAAGLWCVRRPGDWCTPCPAPRTPGGRFANT